MPLPLMLAQLLLMLALPVALGMFVRFRRPALAGRTQPLMRVLGFGGISGLILLLVARPKGLRLMLEVHATVRTGGFVLGPRLL